MAQTAASTAAGTGEEQRAVPQGAPLSHAAQRAYQNARDKLVQIRTLLRNSNTQSSVGSGFFVSRDGLIITNFHVASKLALEPERYRGVYVPVDGNQGEVELLGFDVAHDLALLRVKDTGAERASLNFRSKALVLAQGERLYSLGNPLDIGFAVTEGTYNGLVQRSFYPRLFFGGAINPGMSGGPVLDEGGQVTAFKMQKHGPYSVPVPDDALARCWGSVRDADFKAFDMVRTNCQLDSQVFAGESTTGFIRLFYEAYDAPKFSALRFARMYSDSMGNERFAMCATNRLTAAVCAVCMTYPCW